MEDLADDRVSEDVIDCHLMLKQKLRGLDKANQRALRDYAVFRLTVFSVHAIEALEETHNEVCVPDVRVLFDLGADELKCLFKLCDLCLQPRVLFRLVEFCFKELLN